VKVLKDAEIPREGIVVRRQPSMTRRADGSYVRWTTRRVSVGRGEGSSRLAFEAAIPRTPRPNASSRRRERRVKTQLDGHTDDMKITATENGPLKVEDPSELELFDHDGSQIDLAGRDTVFLCRCGGSTNKPFCDGTHSKVGFEGARAAVESSEGS